ncbi:MAG TPA: DUF3303 family protein [Tepidiformaceae bacterium]|nr:DUF3303 family protein [Tepidiformaceae bacterium]
MLHLLRVSYRVRPGFSPVEAAEAQRLLSDWQPPEGVRVLRHFTEDGGGRGVMLFELEELTRLVEFVGAFDMHFDFEVAPATDADHPLNGNPSTLTWQHRLSEGNPDLRHY